MKIALRISRGLAAIGLAAAAGILPSCAFMGGGGGGMRYDAWSLISPAGASAAPACCVPATGGNGSGAESEQVLRKSAQRLITPPNRPR